MSEAPVITIDMLAENQREIAEVIGLDNYLKLSMRFGGDDIYIQKYSELLKPSRDKEIIERFNGYNYSELAAEYDLSTRTIYKLVSPLIRERKAAPLPDQLSFSD